ncbi:hypothetical protein GQ55_3G367900 [Panicum hallii var. hallii]|uniref:Uncharacterized protein n=1 Tax=Panicum hallii var. hallii TaxID=1504633 RepID=A0A2T7EG65_9POAL|nr:hypothetical protein GQ55_3G367900 [Panicum hallii var. hallii]
MKILLPIHLSDVSRLSAIESCADLHADLSWTSLSIYIFLLICSNVAPAPNLAGILTSWPSPLLLWTKTSPLQKLFASLE